MIILLMFQQQRSGVWVQADICSGRKEGFVLATPSENLVVVECSEFSTPRVKIGVTMDDVQDADLRDRNFLSFDFRLTRCSGTLPSPSASLHASGGLPNPREPSNGEHRPGTALPETRSRAPLPPPRAHPAQAAAADMKLRMRR